MTIINTSSVTASIVGSSPVINLSVLQADITLDEQRAPYVEARLVIATPDVADLLELDPRGGVRILVTYTDVQIEPSSSTTTRTFDLLLHVREYQAGDSTVSLALVSDEAQLIDLGYTEQKPTSAVAPWTLRAIINSVLAKYGAILETGAADADYTPYFDTTNDLGGDGTSHGVGVVDESPLALLVTE